MTPSPYQILARAASPKSGTSSVSLPQSFWVPQLPPSESAVPLLSSAEPGWSMEHLPAIQFFYLSIKKKKKNYSHKKIKKGAVYLFLHEHLDSSVSDINTHAPSLFIVPSNSNLKGILIL